MLLILFIVRSATLSSTTFQTETNYDQVFIELNHEGAGPDLGPFEGSSGPVDVLVAPGSAIRWSTAELKGSIGEGPNHSNHSNHSNSFKIGIFRNFSLENSKISENSKFQHFLNYRRNSDKFHQNLSKNQ